MRDFDYVSSPAKLLTPEIVQMVGSINEHKGKQELFFEDWRSSIRNSSETV